MRKYKEGNLNCVDMGHNSVIFKRESYKDKYEWYSKSYYSSDFIELKNLTKDKQETLEEIYQKINRQKKLERILK
jgi:hypothetical protein